MKSEGEHLQAAEVDSATSNGAAMTMMNASPPARGRRIKFTPQVIEQIKGFVAVGISRDEIANRVGATVGSLQVTCSRLGISLRRIVSQPAARAAPLAKFAIMMRYRGKERPTEIPLPSPAIEVLALEAVSRDLDIARLIGQILVGAISKDTMQEILRDKVLPSSA